MAHNHGHRGQNLSISVPHTMAQQAGGQPLFSPALPTALQTQFRPSMAHGLPHPLSLTMNALQTPMQAQFFPPPSPFVPGHNQRGSIVGPPPHFAIPGQNMIPGVNAPLMQPNMPNNQSMGHGHGRSSSVSLPFNRNRRQGSISLGGPPKATLGGPQNKHVAAPLTNPATSAAALEKTLKGKKLIVKPPVEGPNEEGIVHEYTRYPVPQAELPAFEEPASLDIKTADIYPEERPRDQFPKTLEVFLPGKDAWETLTLKMVEEKLKKLGLEPNGDGPTFTHGVHGRAASMSSPADHTLLMYKLSKLHQTQALSPNLSNFGLSVSPGPRASSTSPRPNTIPAGRFSRPGSHGHSLSLANPMYAPHGYKSNGAFNPFGPAATLGSDQIISPAMSAGSGKALLQGEERAMTPEESQLYAPRGVHGRLGAASSKIDFVRGFGLGTTEETEEELEDDEGSQAGASEFAASEIAATLQEELDAIPEVDEPPSKPGSRIHSRHVSRISAALSLRSLGRGGKSDSGILEEDDDGALDADQGARAWESEGAIRSAEEKRPVHEWSDDESVGEYSNPSDEERAREARRLRRAKKLSKEKQPFTFPGTLGVPSIPRARELDSDDIVSNPSEEERVYQRRSSGSRPLPAIPTSTSHSRSGSGQVYIHSRSPSGQLLPHAIPLPHSRDHSGQFATNGSAHGTPPMNSAGLTPGSVFAINHRDSLNPNAKPFIFGKPLHPPTRAAAPVVPQSANQLNPAAPAFKPNIAAPEFKPSFTVKEFVPSSAASEFKPKLPGLELNPSGITGAFKSNSGSNDFKAEKPLASDFTFQPPPSAPTISFPEPEPELPVNAFGRAVQGREKRLRKDEDSILSVANPKAEVKAPTPVGADSQTWNHLSSFTFPPDVQEMDQNLDEISPVAVTKPFVFPPKKAATAPALSQVTSIHESPEPEILQLPSVLPQVAKSPEVTGIARSPKPLPLSELPRRDSAGIERPISSATSSGTTPRALPQPPLAQTTLNDYKSHPVSSNTVPASLFKNLPNLNSAPDDDAPLGLVRSHLRSKLGSRELFEHNHRQSMDDVHMPMIARKVPRVHEMEVKEPSQLQNVVVTTEVVTTKRRSSLPMPRSAGGTSLDSDVESPVKKQLPVDSQKSDKAIDMKFETLLQDIRSLVESHLLRVNATTSSRAEEALMRIAHLMREQAAERQAYNPTSDRHQQASLNSELIRNIVEDSNKEVCISVQRDLTDFARHIQSGVQQSPGEDILRTVEEQASRIITAVSGATMNLVSRLEAVQFLVEQPQSTAPSHNRVPSHEDLLRVLRPHLEDLRSAPFDVDVVTARLADAVKPTLADFIDLASDKAETADLIVAKLAPVFAALRPAPFETQVVAAQLAADVNRLAPPLDSHALTEQVADLVVERLDSRLAVRDRALKPELTAQKVTEAIKPLVSTDTLNDVVERLTQQEARFDHHGDQIQALETAILQSVNAIPEQLRPILDQYSMLVRAGNFAASPTLPSTGASFPAQQLDVEALKQLLVSQLEPLVTKASSGTQSISSSQASLVELAQQTQNMLDSGLSDLLHGQETRASQLQELINGHGSILKQLSSIPEHLTATGHSLRSAQSEFLSKLRSLPDIVELQNQRMELQVQLAKARSNHGQVRSEKEVLHEKLISLEAERDRLRTELQTAKTVVADKDTDAINSTSKVAQLDSVLQQALSRVEASEAIARTLKDQIIRMEGTQRDMQKTNNEHQVKVESLELQLSFANRDKDAAQDALKRAEQERDTAVEQQQEGWRESRLMSQKIDSLMQLLVAKENDELRELRRAKDRSKGLEAEITVAKTRVTELETRVEGLVRSEAKAAQSVDDAKRQLQDYETKLQKLEREIEPLRRLDDAQKTRDREFEQIRSQLQLQERQEDSLRRNNIELQEELTTVRAELEIAQKAQATAKWQQHQAKEPSAPAYARAAPTTNGRTSAVSGVGSSRSNTPPATQGGVWSSMHAPSKNGKVPPGYQSVKRSSLQGSGRQVTHSSRDYQRPASPAQSVVSQAPTLREDGWWDV